MNRVPAQFPPRPPPRRLSRELRQNRFAWRAAQAAPSPSGGDSREEQVAAARGGAKDVKPAVLVFNATVEPSLKHVEQSQRMCATGISSARDRAEVHLEMR